MLEQLTEEDASEGSGPDTEVEEAEAEEEAVYEDAMACLGMTIVRAGGVMGDETATTSSTARASSPNCAIKSNIRGSREVHAAVPAASLDRLPETVLQQIFLYIVDQYWEASYQVIPLERVCKAMHWALRPEGKFWNLFAPWRVKSLGQVSYGGKIAHSNRERVCWIRGLRNIRKYQFHSMFSTRQSAYENVILSVLEEYEDGNGADNFRFVAAGVMAKMMKPGKSPLPTVKMGTPRLRGDTVGYLAELLQARAIKRLEDANLAAIHAQREQIVVTRDDMLAVDNLRVVPLFGHGAIRPCNVGMKQHHSAPNFCSCSCTSSSGIQWCWPEDDCLVDDVLQAEARRKIVRRLAYRAGIVKLTSEVFDLVAAELLHSLGVLLVDAFEVSREAQLQRFGQDLNFIRHTTQYLTYGEPCDGDDMQSAGIDMFSTPPPPMPASEDPDRPYESGYAYTIVPGQIKNAALKRFSGQGGPYHVYGDTWVAGFGFTCEEEKEKEESYYFSENIEDPSPSLLQRVEAERDELARRLAIYEYDSDYESESDGSSESDEDDYSAGAMSIGY